jgi:hypothetical protein
MSLDPPLKSEFKPARYYTPQVPNPIERIHAEGNNIFLEKGKK